MATIAELETKRAALDEKIAKAKKAAAYKNQRAWVLAQLHLKHAAGGFVIGFLKDPEQSPDLKKIMLEGMEEGVTKDPKNLARVKFEEIRKAAGV